MNDIVFEWVVTAGAALWCYDLPCVTPGLPITMSFPAQSIQARFPVQIQLDLVERVFFGGNPLIAASRIQPWLPARWGCRGQRLSRA